MPYCRPGVSRAGKKRYMPRRKLALSIWNKRVEKSSSACPECGAAVTVRALVGPVTAGFLDSPDEPMTVVSEMELATCRKCGALLRRVKSEPAVIWELTGL